MTDLYAHRLTVPPAAIDRNGHASNLEYLRWMQDAAMAHSAALGWTPERYDTTGTLWVVRTHHIEYLQPAYAGDGLIVYTWVSGFRKVRSWRRYKVVRDSDGAALARGETEWAFIDAASGRPRPILAELVQDFPLLPPEREP